MNFEFSPKVQELRERLLAFMDAHIYPNEALYLQQIEQGDRWEPVEILAELKGRAREAGLWNLFLPKEYGQFSPGLTTLQYAPLAEIMGRVILSPEVFNCNAPDTGNMEVLVRYGQAPVVPAQDYVVSGINAVAEVLELADQHGFQRVVTRAKPNSPISYCHCGPRNVISWMTNMHLGGRVGVALTMKRGDCGFELAEILAA